jgi:hypothetical protein
MAVSSGLSEYVPEGKLQVWHDCWTKILGIPTTINQQVDQTVS